MLCVSPYAPVIHLLLTGVLLDILPVYPLHLNAIGYPLRRLRITKIYKYIVFYVQQVILCRLSKYHPSHVLFSSSPAFPLLLQLYWFCLPALLYSLHQLIYIIPILQYPTFLQLFAVWLLTHLSHPF